MEQVFILKTDEINLFYVYILKNKENKCFLISGFNDEGYLEHEKIIEISLDIFEKLKISINDKTRHIYSSNACI